MCSSSAQSSSMIAVLVSTENKLICYNFKTGLCACWLFYWDRLTFGVFRSHQHYRDPCLQEALLFSPFAKGGNKALFQKSVRGRKKVLIASKTNSQILLLIILHEVVQFHLVVKNYFTAQKKQMQHLSNSPNRSVNVIICLSIVPIFSCLHKLQAHCMLLYGILRQSNTQ